MNACTLCPVYECVGIYTCCGQGGSLGIHTVEGCVLVNTLFSAVVWGVLS